MVATKSRQIEWKPATRKDLAGLSGKHPDFVFPSFTFLTHAAFWKGGIVGVDERLEVHALVKGKWSTLETGASEAYEQLRQQDENHLSILVEHERITAVSGCGCVLELAPGKTWTMLHRPKTKDFEKLCEAALVRDPSQNRLVAFRGGTFPEVNRTGRIKAQRTFFLEKDGWRASKQETKDPNRIDWIGPKLFFDTKRKRLIRLYGDGVGVLEKDTWAITKPDSFHLGAWLSEGYVPLHDPKSQRTLVLVTGHPPAAGEQEDFVGAGKPFESWTGNELHVLSFDGTSFAPIVDAPAAPGPTVFDAEARCLLSESKGTVYALDLAPFFQ